MLERLCVKTSLLARLLGVQSNEQTAFIKLLENRLVL